MGGIALGRGAVRGAIKPFVILYRTAYDGPLCAFDYLIWHANESVMSVRSA